MSAYTPRPGSTAYLTIEHLRAHGPTGELALAAAIDKETSGLRALLGWAMSMGAITSEVVGDEWVYSLGDGLPTNSTVAGQALDAGKGTEVTPEPSKLKASPNTPKGDQPRLERGREVMEPKACESADGRGTDGAPALATLPHNASPVGGPMGVGQPADAGPTEVLSDEFRIALWSDGVLEIRRPGNHLVRFTKLEARRLVTYLEAISLDPVREEVTA